MKYSLNGLHMTEDFEGDLLHAYPDSKGVMTIGYGHTKGVTPGMTCTQAQAEAWLEADLAWAEGVVNTAVTTVLTQNEFDALVDFVFNVGMGNFEHSTLLKLVDEGNLAAAAHEFDKWDKAGGKVVAGLLRRRMAETALFEAPNS